jgi:5-methylcytosine-specific restriction endonuclease McrA
MMIPKKLKKPRQPKLSTLQDKADKAMSLYIRQKFAGWNGYTACVSCGRVFHWKDVDCGHYVPKSRGAAVRYVEENVHPECHDCNRFNEGHLIGYTLYMVDMYGRDKIDELKKEARKTLKPSEKRAICEEAIEYYTQALIDLKQTTIKDPS